MKKGVTYLIDVCIDENAIVLECQCECGAGMGPESHCKHVRTVLWALICHSNGVGVITEQTCTERLQTFHKVKKHTGTPAKSESLRLGSSATNFDVDPRPKEYTKNDSYPSYVRNMCINFQSANTMPFEQTIEPANSYAVVHDHPYCKDDLEDKFLEKISVTHISESQRRDIEENTRKQSKCKRWKEERCKRLQSSHFGRICKATYRPDFNKLAFSMTKSSSVTAASLKHGQKYESVAIKRFEEKCNVRTKSCGIFVSETYPYIAA